MTYNDRDFSAVYALNSYLKRLLEVNLGWNTADYNAGNFVIPLSQQPELMDLGKPFIVYGSAVHGPGHLYALRTDSVAYIINSISATECNQIVNLLVDVFERQDEAAADVNEWIDIENRSPKRGVSFGTVKVNMVERADPADQEGGWVNGMVLIEMKYTVQPHTVITKLTPS